MQSFASDNGAASVSGGFDAFYRDQRDGAIRLAWLLTHDPVASEDVVQDAFGEVFRRFDSIAAPAAYLRTVIVHSVYGVARGASRQRRREVLHAGGIPRIVEGPTGGLADAVAALPLPERTAVVLRYWADLDHNEIATIMGVRPGTARSLLSRATARLRKVIER